MRGKMRLTPRKRRHIRIRARVSGTPERPRLSVFRSSQHIYAQVVDDTRGYTLAAASTLDQDLREECKALRGVDEARLVGRLVAERAKEKGISAIVFDRGGWKYHGRVASLADGAREGGLEF